ncbi:NAD(+) synthetase [Sulfodiicoccus acidiphilus]|uniref:NH(3)-dependent NAD(+) synthetase n=1 Tax=Sulfodiicoccus acidiphilus TaxID=1670455 RepID=A0A348B4K4_9CREN|nr:NAD(+) synthetase [Sulfodiicoccus acidiphilus]GGU00741.1 NAD(+) synthetase [Sulfodiicoccus acidiphilus]
MDLSKVRNSLVGQLRDYIRSSGRRGGVMGLSGGVDSSVTAALLSEATENNFFLIMPSRSTPPRDVEDALSLVRKLGAENRYAYVEIDDVVDSLASKVGTSDRVVVGNMKARVRMTLLYAYASKLDYLVVGTGDKSELLLGYFTKYGDGGVDVLPIGGLYKTQVRSLARFLGLPESIVSKPSSPALWEGQTAEGELGIGYEVADPILYLLIDNGMSVRDVASTLGVGEDIVSKVWSMVKSSEHKRTSPVIFSP